MQRKQRANKTRQMKRVVRYLYVCFGRDEFRTYVFEAVSNEMRRPPYTAGMLKNAVHSWRLASCLSMCSKATVELLPYASLLRSITYFSSEILKKASKIPVVLL